MCHYKRKFSKTIHLSVLTKTFYNCLLPPLAFDGSVLLLHSCSLQKTSWAPRERDKRSRANQTSTRYGRRQLMVSWERDSIRSQCFISENVSIMHHITNKCVAVCSIAPIYLKPTLSPCLFLSLKFQKSCLYILATKLQYTIRPSNIAPFC